MLHGNLHGKPKKTEKLTLVAGRGSSTFLKPGCPNVNHLLLVQGWEVNRSAGHSIMQDVAGCQAFLKLLQIKGRLLSWVGSLLCNSLCWEQPPMQVVKTCVLVVEGFVRPPAKESSEGVVQVLGEAHVLQLLAIVVHSKHCCLAATRYQWLNQALHTCNTCMILNPVYRQCGALHLFLDIVALLLLLVQAVNVESAQQQATQFANSDADVILISHSC